MTLTNDEKAEEELTCRFKTDTRILTNLTRALKNLKNLHFNGLLLNKVYKVPAKKSIEEFALMELNTDATFERKLTCAFKNHMGNFANFNQSMLQSLKIGI